MFVLIAGGGRTGAQLASLLLAENHQVKLIEHRPQLLTRLHRELPTEAIFEGISINPDVLESAGIRHAHVLAATTDTDANNLVLCYIARKMFNVPRIIARINNPRNAWLFTEKFKVDVALNQADVLAHLIQEEMSLGDMMTLLKMRRGLYSLVEEKVHPKSYAIGKSLKDIKFPSECVVVAIIRKNDLLIPRGDTVLLEADEVLALVHGNQLHDFAGLLAPDHPISR